MAPKRFADLCTRPETEVHVDDLAWAIAESAYPDLDPMLERRRMDMLADRCGSRVLDDLSRYLFVEEHFRGNRRAYYDPRNSYLNDVLDRRLGIPISLAVVVLGVARRLDVPLVGVGMPGHFLVSHAARPDTYLDPFSGQLLDTAGCAAIFRRIHGSHASFDRAWLEPVGTFAIIGRMLANLRSIFLSTEDRQALTWVSGLRSQLPGATAHDHREHASALAATGRFIEAAEVHESLAAGSEAGGDDDIDLRTAIRLRARLN